MEPDKSKASRESVKNWQRDDRVLCCSRESPGAVAQKSTGRGEPPILEAAS